MNKFQKYKTVEDYEKDNLLYIEPMLAKEIEESKQDELFFNRNYIVEEKFDGTRATLHFTDRGIRLFSRRKSEKTGWLVENSDSVPHIRDIEFPESLIGTILDGELFIPDRPFKDVSSTLNCLPEEAIKRQESIGNIVFHCFDILYYQKKSIRTLVLDQRKKYAQSVINSIGSPFLKNVKFYYCGEERSPKIVNHKIKSLTAKEYYEEIVKNGGEGVIVKNKNGIYEEGKRSWAYTKIKKFYTKDCILLNFNDPTEEYKGKYPTPEKWYYWETNEGDFIDTSDMSITEIKTFKENFYNDGMCVPISKYKYMSWVGNMIVGVIISDEDKKILSTKKEHEIRKVKIDGEEYEVLVVGECSGFDEEMREEFSKNIHRYLNTVVEIKCNEIFKDTGKMRHPRFSRLREDKNIDQCVFKDHIL